MTSCISLNSYICLVRSFKIQPQIRYLATLSLFHLLSRIQGCFFCCLFGSSKKVLDLVASGFTLFLVPSPISSSHVFFTPSSKHADHICALGVLRLIQSIRLSTGKSLRYNIYESCGEQLLMNMCCSHNLCCPVSWGCRIHWLHLYRWVRPPLMSVLDMTLNNLMVRFQQCWSFGECGVPLHCHRSQVHSGPEW